MLLRKVAALLSMLPQAEGEIDGMAADTHSKGGGENQPKLLHSTLMQTLGEETTPQRRPPAAPPQS